MTERDIDLTVGSAPAGSGASVSADLEAFRLDRIKIEDEIHRLEYEERELARQAHETGLRLADARLRLRGRIEAIYRMEIGS